MDRAHRDGGECRCWLVALPAVDGRQYVYRAYGPEDALLADLFREAWHCHDESALPRAWDVFDAAETWLMGRARRTGPCFHIF